MAGWLNLRGKKGRKLADVLIPQQVIRGGVGGKGLGERREW